MNNPEIAALIYALEKFDILDKKLGNPSDEVLEKLFHLVFKNNSPRLGTLTTIFSFAEGFSGQNIFLPVSKYHPFDSFPSSQNESVLLKEYITKLDIKNTLFEKNKDLNSIHYSLKDLFGNIGIENLKAGSLYSYLKSFAGISKAVSESKTGELIFIGGDLSGIQSFIYRIISKYAAKNLKGRSFYLQLLADAAVLRFQSELGLSDFNLIYSSGGGFFMYCADSEENVAIIKKVRKEIESEIFEKHGLDLYFSIDFVRVDPENLCQSELTQNWSDLIEKTNIRKRQKLQDQISNKFESFFSPISTSELGIRDAITNEEIYSKKDAKQMSGDLEGSYLRSITHFQIKLGKLLKSCEYLNYKVSDFDVNDPSTIFGIKFLLSNQAEEGYNNFKINPLPETKIENGIFYGGNSYPSDPSTKEPITFDELASSTESGVKRLGILRMDVDNLGKLFIKGFGNQTHIAAYNELSFRLDGFFKGYLNHLIEKEAYKSKVMILYSGGDDLFIAGAYQAVLELAADIRIKFKEWAGNSMQPGLSGGIAIVDGKFPVIKAAELAGELEKKAKGYTLLDRIEKNAMCLFDIPFSWEHEYDEVKRWSDNWKEWLSSRRISRSVLFKIFQYYDSKEKNEVSWQWHSLYTLKRQENDKNIEIIKTLKSDVLLKGKNNYRALDLCVIGGRLAELSLRN